MGWLSTLVTGGANDLAKTAVDGVSAIGKIIDDNNTTDQEKIEGISSIIAQAGNIDQLQMKLNIMEVAHRSLFVAGWRPFVGWVCGCGFAYNFILRPLVDWATTLALHIAGLAPIAPLPVLDLTQLGTLLIAMLGMGTLRTTEKLKDKIP